MSQTPAWSTILKGAGKRSTADLRVALPGRIESYDPATQKANVQPLIMDGVTLDDGARGAEALPVVTDVPVIFPGAGAYRLTFPVAAGDIVLLVFASSSLDRWLVRGGMVDPEDDRRHNVSDAVAIPGLFSFNAPPTNAPTTNMVLHAPGGVRLVTENANDPVVRRSDLDAVVSVLKTHVHAGVTTGGGSSLASPTMTSLVTPACSPDVKVP